MLKFELTDQHIAVIGECLSNGPFKTVAPVINELQQQIDAQRAAPDQPAAQPPPHPTEGP